MRQRRILAGGEMNEFWAHNAFFMMSFGVNAYILMTCAAKKAKKDVSKMSLMKASEIPKVEKVTTSDEKASDSVEKVVKKEDVKKEDVKKEDVKKEDVKKEDVKEEKKEQKKSKMLEIFKKEEEKKEEKKKEEKKKEESKKMMKKEKKSKSESKSDEEEEKPPAPGSDPRKIWAFKAAKLKCQAISKLHQDKIKGFVPPNCTYTASDANPDLNRYTDVRCIEETRVILKHHDRDYIHASWMRMPGGSSPDELYITTQGPLQETLADFWHMVFQEKIAYVLMLCTLFEGGVEKCCLYYPEKLGESVKYGKYEITLTECKEEAVAGTTWNALTVVDTSDSASEPHIMNHVQVPWWPDQLAPEDAKPMITLYKWVKSVNPKGTPICVHCSAGVGRTATFVGIDYATRRIMENPSIEMVDIVREMRGMRFQAVQSHMQFLFLYVALLEYFIEEGVVERTGRIESFMEQYKKHALKKLAKRQVQNKKGEQEAAEQKELKEKEVVKA